MSVGLGDRLDELLGGEEVEHDPLAIGGQVYIPLLDPSHPFAHINQHHTKLFPPKFHNRPYLFVGSECPALCGPGGKIMKLLRFVTDSPVIDPSRSRRLHANQPTAPRQDQLEVSQPCPIVIIRSVSV